MPHTPGPRTRPLLIAASIPSVLSLAWTAWSLADMIPAPLPIALAAGVALDIMLVAAVAIAWMAPAAARLAQTISWIIAALAAVAIGVHSFEITPALVLLAPLPLVAKGLWHLALVAKSAADTAATEAAAREAELDDGLTEEQQIRLARIRRDAAYARAEGEAQRELTAAHSDVDHQERLDQIRRRADEQMATDEASARIHVRRHELAQQIRLAAPVTTPEIAGPRVPDDISSLTDMGFGAELEAHPGGTHPDLDMPPAAPQGASPRLPRHEQQMNGPQGLLTYITEAGAQATVKGAARWMGVHPRTIRRYRQHLAEAGHDMSALNTDTADQ
ncbi:hypothetical protein ACFWZ7_14435 [Nocardiopsis alba]|uniref:hypothetical protein n=1 Tax=Nocardiopsis alba TaxID=53437 RepID=UPI003670B370